MQTITTEPDFIATEQIARAAWQSGAERKRGVFFWAQQKRLQGNPPAFVRAEMRKLGQLCEIGLAGHPLRTHLDRHSPIVPEKHGHQTKFVCEHSLV